ncbi:MAG: ATP-dependent RNA helicase HrpA [Desulfobacteraceae bacterium]
MKRIKKIEKKINDTMCQDRPGFIREIVALKRAMAKDSERSSSGEAGRGAAGKEKILGRRLSQLEQRVATSLETKKQREASLPRLHYNPDLPITAKKDQIIDAVKASRVVIISGETGSGKTTQIPKFCMEAGRGSAGKIGCTQPRRIAAINVAHRIAEEMEEELGRSVGYKIRFDDRSVRDSRVKLMTDGILLAETQRDPFLNEYDTIIVDEAHERSLNIDFCLGILRDLVKKRKDLKLIITSATIDTEKFSKAFDMAPVIEVSGRTFPVEVRYADPADGQTEEASDSDAGDDQGYVEAAVDALDTICTRSSRGDILIFMPTEQDIEETMGLIRGRGYPGLSVMPLFARLPAREQAGIFSTGAGRKVIVATNVAETSLTIPGIKYVIDSGLARIPAYSPRTRTTALPVRAISQSSADQRKGRCGRVANGICIRLFSEADYGARPFFTSPEILRSNLAEVILRMISLKLGDVAAFPFIDPPSAKSIKDGFDTLLELNAIQEKSPGKGKKKTFVLTEKGRIMASLPLDPKLSRILIEADHRNCLEQALVIVSALSIADPRQRPHDTAQQADQKHARFKDTRSDFVTLLNIWEAFETAETSLKTRGKVRSFCRENFLSFKRMREWKDIRYQIRSVLKEHGITAKGRKGGSRSARPVKGLKAKKYEIGGEEYIELHKSLLCGYLANIAHRKEKHLFNAAKGQQAMIFPGSGLFKHPGEWIVAAEYVKTSRLFARTAATIDPAWLEELGRGLCTYTWSDPHWEKKRGEVVASEQVFLFGLVIVAARTVGYGRINKQEAGEIFLRSALVNGEVERPFPFMEHNQALMDQLADLEDKTRTRDILVTEEEIFQFYQQRIGHDFSDIRSFAKYLKDKNDDLFLRMTLEDLQNTTPDEEILASFPDHLDMGGVKLKLEYDFQPGKEKDGVTIKVPAASASSIANAPMERLVPGLFKEKIEALIKALPKKQRKKLLPVSHRADIISREMTDSGRPLFLELSRFAKKRFNVDIPASAWSDREIDQYLKMGISLRDSRDREVAFSRDSSLLKSFSGEKNPGGSLEQARKQYEKEEITQWDFGDIETPVRIQESRDLAWEFFYGLSCEDGRVALRLFRSRAAALAAHKKGVAALYAICYERDISALKKDIRSSRQMKKYASTFGPWEPFAVALSQCLLADIFAVNVTTRQGFYDHADKTVPLLYKKGADFIQNAAALCQGYENTLSLFQRLALKNQNRPQVLSLLERLQKEAASLVPDTFPKIYTPERIGKLPLYLKGMGIRAERGAVEPARDEKKQQLVDPYGKKFDHLLQTLDESSTGEKAEMVETFFWMIEEYKVSLFAQELKTSIKISPKRLDAMYQKIMAMV